MAKFELIMPKMGESIMEATILNWSKNVGDSVETDETILEIATDKVDSEIPSPVDGVIKEILFKENDVVEIGKVIAIIETEGDESGSSSSDSEVEQPVSVSEQPASRPEPEKAPEPVPATQASEIPARSSDRFYSPLVRNIAKQEGVNISELDAIEGTGMNGRVTKNDLLNYLEQRKSGAVQQKKTTPAAQPSAPQQTSQPAQPVSSASSSPSSMSGDVEIIEMDRMRKLIADHMVRSKHTSPHVTSFVEADVTNIVRWRNKIKGEFQKKYEEKITFTPIFIEAILKALRDFPMVNISLDGDKIIRKKHLNIGMAAALPSGNLIVPVIHDADQYNLVGLTRKVNDLANRARNNQLKPEEIQGGTFTLTNVGTFGNVMGTPIINQPQVAILAAGAIRKKPAVLETPEGDVIAIRHMMFLSLSYDHRIVDGMLGGSFLKRIADYLEDFDGERDI